MNGRCAASASYQPGTNLRLWLMTIMYNLFLDRCRRQAREPRVMAIDEGDIPNPEANSPEPWEGDHARAGARRASPISNARSARCTSCG